MQSYSVAVLSFPFPLQKVGCSDGGENSSDNPALDEFLLPGKEAEKALSVIWLSSETAFTFTICKLSAC